MGSLVVCYLHAPCMGIMTYIAEIFRILPEAAGPRLLRTVDH